MTEKRAGNGCLLAMIVINSLILGLVAVNFAQGSYSSRGQELWYRYGSIGFLLLGAIVPALATLLGAARASWAAIALVAWMIGALLAAFGYLILSGGGV